MRKKQHVKCVKIGACLVALTLATFSPIAYASVAKTALSGYMFFVVYINNFANFFIYFWIDDKFRKAVFKDFGYKVQPSMNTYSMPQLMHHVPVP